MSCRRCNVLKGEMSLSEHAHTPDKLQCIRNGTTEELVSDRITGLCGSEEIKSLISMKL